ncbi:MAG TPA: glycosyltransferase family 39 protein [Minicystis sp.]|nr:glycosyltransferase family 39 protein [Minicystis sp.]
MGVGSHVIAALLLALFAAICVGSMPSASPTLDEPLHFTRGAAWWWTGDTRLSWAHPPLANVLAALPSRSHPIVDLRAIEPEWDHADNGALASAIMKADYGEFRRDLFRGRLVMIALAVLFGVYLHVFCARRWGARTAFVALLLYAIHPTVIAHARLVTTDMPVAALSFVTLGELVRYLESRGKLWPLATMALALAAALCTKYSAAFLIPVLGVAGFAFALRGRGRFAAQGFARRMGTFAAHAVFTTLVCVTAVNAAYRFERTGMTVAQILAERPPESELTPEYGDTLLRAVTPLDRLPQGLRVPLPYTYVFGVSTMSTFNESGRSSYFFGFLTSGTPAYFPVLLVLKQPLVMVLLLALGVAAFFRHRASASRVTRLLAYAAAFFVLLAIRSRLNIGVRHVLPAIVILVVLAARAWQRLRRARATNPEPFLAARGLAVLSLGGTLAAYPHYIGYFNLLAGPEALANQISTVGEDWSQDVGDAARIVRAKHLEPLYYNRYGRPGYFELRYFGVEPHEAKCDRRPRTPGWVMLHVSAARRLPSCFHWLGLPGRAPDISVREHIWLFRYGGRRGRPAAPDPEPEDDGAANDVAPPR